MAKRKHVERRHGSATTAHAEGPARILVCAQDVRRDLHLVCNEAGRNELVAAVTQLLGRPKTTTVTVDLERTTKLRCGGILFGFEIRRVFSKLRIERVDDPTVLSYLYASNVGDEMAEVRIARQSLPEYLEWFTELAKGAWDLSLCAPPAGVSRRKWKERGTALDHASGGIWLWGGARSAP